MQFIFDLYNASLYVTFTWSRVHQPKVLLRRWAAHSQAFCSQVGFPFVHVRLQQGLHEQSAMIFWAGLPRFTIHSAQSSL